MELKKHLLLPFLAMSLAVSCSEKEGPENEGSDSWGDNIPEGNTEVTISADRKSVYLNPLSGWVIYVPLIDDVDRFWREYENFPSSEGTVNVFDYGNIIYLRGSWTDFNPEEGVYIWQDGIDETKYPLARSLRLFEEGAKERGLKLAFTLKTDSRDANANCTPQFVRDKMDAAGIKPDDVQTLEDLKRLPFTYKADFRDNYPDGLFAVDKKEIVR